MVEPVAISIPEQKTFDGVVFPLVLAPNATGTPVTIEEANDWVKKNTAWLVDQAQKHGAILFRGWPTKTPALFSDFVESFGFEALPYIGGAAPRTNVVGHVFTANEAPPHLFIPFHHEMAQLLTGYPKRLFFYCEVAPSQGGQTPICLSNEVYKRVLAAHPDFVRQLGEKGVRYIRVLGEGDDNESAIGRGWQSTFLTKDKAVAEQRCREVGNEWEWLPDGGLKTISHVLPAVREDDRSGLKTWFNSIVAAYTGWKDTRNTPEKAVVFGDYTPLPSEAVLYTLDAMNETAVDFPWQQGDALFVDNKVTMHGRRAFAPPRRILAYLAK